MADPRKSVALALEKGKFGKGFVLDANDNEVDSASGTGVFYALPPGTWISHSNEFKAESIYATGSKLRETAAYGPFSGSWSIHFIMDYEHTEFLDLVFDNHTVSEAVSGVTTDTGASVYDHIWEKDNAKFIKPFVIREKILNRIANSANPNALDEVVLLKGCLVKDVEFNRSQQGSQMEVRMSGVFADMEVQLAQLDGTDYTPYNNTVGPSQYSCMFMDGEEEENYVRDVDSHAIKLAMDTSLVYNTCTPFATSYFEGQTHITWDAKTFMNDPLKKFQLRPFSGGKDAAHLKPMAKGLMPMEEVYFTTYNLSMRDQGYESITEPIAESPYLIKFELQDSTVNAMSWPDGEGEKMTDSLQGIETTKLILTVRNTHETTDWGNTINNDGKGQEYTPVTVSLPKLNPVVTSEDPDLGYTSGDPLEFDMGEGKYIIISASDINRGKILRTGTAGQSFTDELEGWFEVPFDTPLYDPPADGPATLQELFGLTSEEVDDLTADGLEFTTNWAVKEIVYNDEGTLYNEEVLGYYPGTIVSGTLTNTMGTYKHYMVKGHLVDRGNGKVLVVEDRGIFRLEVTSTSQGEAFIITNP